MAYQIRTGKQNGEGLRYTDHQCRITIDKDGNTLSSPVIQKFDMSSSKKDTTIPGMEYIGFGSFWSYKKDGRVKIIEGENHFFRRK